MSSFPAGATEPVLALEQLGGGYSHLRPALHAVLDTVGLRGASSADDELLATLKRVRATRERFVDEPVELLPKTWRAWVLDDDGRVQRTRYELGLWFVARDALRAGRCIARSGAATPTRPASACPLSAGTPTATSSRSRSAAR